jgi:hypothetical protein
VSAKSLNFYKEHYGLMRSFLLTGSKKLFLGQGQAKCRYCGCTRLIVSFRNKAHAIPESFGNKTLFTKYECDSCGNFFSETIENDFGNYFKPYRAFARIRGKNGVPKIKNEVRGWRIDADAGGLNMQHRAADTLMERDLERKILRFRIPRDPYTPVGVFKCFVKMALAIIPEGEIPLFLEAIDWIRTRDHGAMPLSQAVLYEIFTDGMFPFRAISALVLKRKMPTAELPYAMFIIAHANSWLQIAVPCPQRDAHVHGKEITFPLFPPTLPKGAANRMALREIDLSGTTPVNDVAEFEMGFDSYSVTTRSA